MIPLKSFEKTGYTPESLKSKFTAETKDKRIENLIDIIDGRVREGIEMSIENAPVYHAIDSILSRPLKQTSIAAANFLLEKKDSLGDDWVNVAKDLGLSHMLTEACDANGRPLTVKGTGKKIYQLDLPVFHEIFVPLALAYTKARWAACFNAIDQDPLYSYSPAIPTDKNKILGNIFNGVIKQMSEHMGYRADERQSMWQTLAYGHCLNFPQEPWYKEFVETPDGKKKLVRWGVRSAVPHPSKTAIDLSHRSSTVNFGTGTQWALFWDMYRWGDVMMDKSLWIDNPDSYAVSTQSGGVFATQAFRTYEMLYPCRSKIPLELFRNPKQTDDRADAAFRYTSGMLNKGIAICKSFHKFVPKDFGLFDYGEPVWFMAQTAFTRDIIKLEPLPYDPLVGYFYDKDDHRLIGSSIPLEVSPFEDKVANLLSQYLLTIKRNLNNVVFFNKDGIDEPTIRKIENLSGKAYSSINFVPVSLSKLEQKGVDPRSLLMPVSFPLAPSAETINGIKMVIEIADRLLGFSAAEAGTSLPREITATQDTTIKQNVATRRQFTLSAYSEGMEAKKRMLAAAFIEYGPDEVIAQVAADQLDIKPENAKAILEELGFSVDDEWNNGGNLGVSGPKTPLSLVQFASGRDGVNRASDSQIAGQMLQMFQAVFSNQAIIERVGIETAIGWLNNIAIYAGLPTSMRLRVTNPQPRPDEMMAAVQQMVAQMGQQQMAQLGQAIQQNMLAPMQAEIAKAVAAVADRLSRLEGAAGIHPQQGQPQPTAP